MNTSLFPAMLTAATLLATPSFATTLGQPFFVADVNTSGSVLDFFDGFGPSGIKEVDASGEITQQYGSTGFLGATLDYSMDINGNGTLSIGTYNFDIFTFTDGFAGGAGDVFADTGLITTTFLVEFPILSSVFDPGTGIETFTLDLDPFGTGLEVDVEDFPFLEIGVNIFYDGALPTRFFDDGLGGFDYIEGAFTPTRIELGLVGGAAVPTPVPLPASLPLIALGAGALGLLRRRHA